MEIGEFIVGLVVVGILGLAAYFTIWQSNVPCSEFSNTDIKNLPARCLNYYQSK